MMNRRMVFTTITFWMTLVSSSLAGELKEIVPVGSGSAATVEIRGSEPMTYLLRQHGQDTWFLDIAQTSPGEIPSVVPLSIPSVRSVTLEKRRVGTIDAVRLVFTVAPSVQLSAAASSDRKAITVSFVSGPKEPSDPFLDDLEPAQGKDATSPSPDTPAPLKDLLDEPVPSPVGKAPVAAVPEADDLLPKKDDTAGAVRPQEGGVVPPPEARPEPALQTAEDGARAERPRETSAAPLPPSPPTESKPRDEVKGEGVKKSSPEGDGTGTPTASAIDAGALTPDELSFNPLTPSPSRQVADHKSDEAVLEPAASASQEPSVTVSGRAFEIVVSGVLSHKAFTLFKPTRVVLDLMGVSVDLAKRLPTAGFPEKVKGVRSSRYPDKTRIVFDMEGEEIPEYVVARTGGAVRVTFP